MSEESVENIRRAVAAFNQGDADAFVALAQPDVEWEDAVFWSQSFRIYSGREELRAWFAEVREPWEDIHITADEMLEAADNRLMVGLGLTARGKGSGVETQLHVWQVNWFVDGKTARRQVFRDRDEAVEAAGLPT
jgi:ketosteroid isomerase-like protein